MGQSKSKTKVKEKKFRKVTVIDKTFFHLFAPFGRVLLPENRYILSNLLQSISEGSTLEKELFSQLEKIGYKNVSKIRSYPTKNFVFPSKLESVNQVFKTLISIVENSSKITVIEQKKQINDLLKTINLKDFEIKKLRKENQKLQEDNLYLEKEVNTELHSQLVKYESMVENLKIENEELKAKCDEFQSLVEDLEKDNAEFRKTLKDVVEKTRYGQRTPKRINSSRTSIKTPFKSGIESDLKIY